MRMDCPELLPNVKTTTSRLVMERIICIRVQRSKPTALMLTDEPSGTMRGARI